MRLDKRQKILIVSLLAFPIVAMATPGGGYVFKYSFNRFTSTANAIHEHAKDTDRNWSVQLNVEGPTDFVQQDVIIAPSGFTGWHSHLGPVLVTVKSGTATWYSGDNPSCTPIIYPSGSAFIEAANVRHYIANKGSDSLELLDTYIIPKGQAMRQEQPQPSQCPF
jgi:quercetin dioxygenase-like cupin family protein